MTNKYLEKIAKKKDKPSEGRRTAGLAIAGAGIGAQVGSGAAIKGVVDKAIKRDKKTSSDMVKTKVGPFPKRILQRAHTASKTRGMNAAKSVQKASNDYKAKYLKAGNKAIRKAGVKGALIGAATGGILAKITRKEDTKDVK